MTIKRSIFWDDAEYLVEELDGGDFGTTRITEDGDGLYVSFDEAGQVTAGIGDDGVEIGRVVS